MDWKNINISKKIGLAVGSVVALLCVVAFITYVGISEILKNAGNVIDGNQLDAMISQKEVDHLNWANKVNALLTDNKVGELTIQTDDHKCGFGYWLYGEDRKHAEKMVPDLKPLLKKIEIPHRILHESAVLISSSFRPADTALPAFLAEKKVDHLQWAASIRDSLLNKDTSLKV